MLRRFQSQAPKALRIFPSCSFGTFEDKQAALNPDSYGPRLQDHEEPRFLEQVKLFFDRAAKTTDIPADILELIKACNTVIRFNIPLQMDDGKITTVTCYRAQHSHNKLPVKGGTRYAENLDL